MRCDQLLWLWSLIMTDSINIGTRGSKLALWQAEWVKSALQEINPSLSIGLEIIKTKGDKILDVPLAGVGGKGLFVKEIEEALLNGRVDLAVHSMKDMPADLPEGLCIGMVPERETPDDIFISKTGRPFSDLKPGSVVGTSSLRRAAQLLHAKPGIEINPLRGNLDTRLRKLDSGEENLDAIVLAAAGIKRLGLSERITEHLDYSIMLPAVGQGALCIEIRKNDPKIQNIIAPLDDPETKTAVLGERSFLNRLEGSCQVPIAAIGNINNHRFTLEGLVADIEGKTIIRDSISGPMNTAENIGIELAERLLAKGADKILAELKSDQG